MNRRDTNEPQPIVIVRRRRMEEDGHHGGAWKIAFADFMTAMMALFLVLWLVNASDADTRKAVASYFNPVKLVDRERSRKGLATPGAPIEEGDEPANAEAETADETEARSDASAAQASAVQASAAEEGAAVDGARFLSAPDPVLDAREEAALSRERLRLAAVAAVAAGTAPIETSLAAELRPDDPFAVDLGGPAEASKAEAGEAEPEARLEQMPEDKPEQKVDPDAKPVPEPKPDDASKGLENELRAAIEAVLPLDEALAGAVEAVPMPGGTLIRLMEGAGFAMFDSGSPVPSGRAIVAMRAVAGVLKGRRGPIRIEGHTDSRPFRGAGDNWRLSTDRAHAARLMLLRAGLDEGRIAAVAGLAAARPLEGVAPEDARNRRIEIFLERP